MGAITGYASGGMVKYMWGGGDLVDSAKGAAGGASGVLSPITGASGSAIGGMLGTNGGINGTGFSQLTPADIKQGTNQTDVASAQTGVNNSLQSQQALLQALQSQNGLGQQNAVAGQQQALANQLQAANGIGTQNKAISGLENTAGMYQNIANGQGPNPAMAALNERTGQNVANQAALMAGQRGASANAGLLARQAGQQGAATQQQAVGQGATMQANQQLNALSGLANTQQAVGGLGGAQLGAQQAQQQALANQANLVAGQQIAGTQANTSAQLANQGQLQQALSNYNTTLAGGQNVINTGNAGLANTGMQGQQKIYGGLLGGAGSVLGMGSGGGAAGGGGAASALPLAAAGAEGGEVKKMAAGGDPAPVIAAPGPVAPIAPVVPVQQPQGPMSSFGQFLRGGFGGGNLESKQEDSQPVNPFMSDKNDPLEKGSNDFSKGLASAFKSKPGVDPTNSSTMAGADVGDNSAIGLKTGEMMAARGGLASAGGHVKAKTPAQKAEKKGNSFDNDKVPALLSEGEVVLPRSVMMSKDPVRSAADFVQKVLAKRKAKS